MNGLDETVRSSLNAQVQNPPAMDRPAEHAIVGARRVRRRRVVIAACAGVVALVLGVGGLVALRTQGPDAPPVPPATQPADPTAGPTAAPAADRPDLLIDPSPDAGWRKLLTAEGRTVSLTGVSGKVVTAYRTADGWLVSTMELSTSSALWLVTPDGAARKLVGNLDAPSAISPDGRRLAWRAGNSLRTGHISGTTLVIDQTTPAPQRGHPIAYTGAAVVLGYSETGGSVDHHDVWLPDKGNYVPSWAATAHLVAVYQPASDGTLLGLVRTSGSGKDVCLARLDPAANLRPTQTACGLPLTVDPLGLVSPDGRRLAAPALDDSGERQVIVVDLHRVFDPPATMIIRWIADGPGPWLDSDTLVVYHDGVWLGRVSVGGLDPLTGLPPGAPAEAVRRLG